MTTCETCAKNCPLLGGGSVVVYSLFIVVPFVCGGFMFCPCVVVLSVLSSFAIILLRQREREREGDSWLISFKCVLACHVAVSVLCLILLVHWV